ncbi:uncharacterized protein ACRADG_010102 isoform 1-T2 [Cochliomyia hominivorax]
MLRLFSNNLKRKWSKISISSILSTQNLHDKTAPPPPHQLTFAGGLEKPQGGLKEEKYFCTQNYDLMTKLREPGSKLKCENSLSDLKDFDKILDTGDELKAFRETCSANKHKNCLEEAFFLEEQSECCSRLRKGNEIPNQTEANEQNLENLENIKNEEDI